MQKLSLSIGGMTCGHCVRGVDSALKQLDGVAVQNVAIGSATLEFDPAKINAEVIAKAVEDEGYKVLATN